jgi:hypothetical protein
MRLSTFFGLRRDQEQYLFSTLSHGSVPAGNPYAAGQSLLWAVQCIDARFIIGLLHPRVSSDIFSRNGCETSFVISPIKELILRDPVFRETHFHKTKRNDAKWYSITKLAKKIRQNDVLYAQYMKFVLLYVWLPVWCPPTFIMSSYLSAKLHYDFSTVTCLPTCMTSAYLYDVCLSI